MFDEFGRIEICGDNIIPLMTDCLWHNTGDPFSLTPNPDIAIGDRLQGVIEPWTNNHISIDYMSAFEPTIMSRIRRFAIIYWERTGKNLYIGVYHKGNIYTEMVSQVINLITISESKVDDTGRSPSIMYLNPTIKAIGDQWSNTLMTAEKMVTGIFDRHEFAKNIMYTLRSLEKQACECMKLLVSPRTLPSDGGKVILYAAYTYDVLNNSMGGTKHNLPKIRNDFEKLAK